MTEPDRDAQERTAQDLLKRWGGDSYAGVPQSDGCLHVDVSRYGQRVGYAMLGASGNVIHSRFLMLGLTDLPEAPARHIDAQTFAQRELVWLSRDDADLAGHAIILLLTLADEMTDLLKVDPIPRRGDLERIAGTLADGNR